MSKAGKHFIMPEELFKKKLYDKFGDTISLIDKYTKATDPMRYKCNKCGNIIDCSSGVDIFYTKGCNVCNGIRTRYTNDEFKSIVESYGKVHVIGEFKNSATKIRVKCNICGNEYNANPYLISHGCGCKKCADKQHGISLRKTHEQFIDDVAKVNPYVRILGIYNGAEQHVDCECTICGHQWSPIASSLQNGYGCPECNMSHGEKMIASFFISHSIEYRNWETFNGLLGVNGGSLSYDFYVPQYNLLIEYQGGQHYFPVEYFGGKKKFEKQKEHDKRKKEYALSHGYNYLEIKYDEDVEAILTNYLNLEPLTTAGAVQ